MSFPENLVAQVSFNPEDRRLVEIAIEECGRYRLEKYAPNGLIWTTNRESDRCELSGGYLRLPQALNGKLRPEEWRALIASTIVQHDVVKRRRHSIGDRDTPYLVVGLLGAFGSIALEFLVPSDLKWILNLTFLAFLVGPAQLSGLSRIRNARLDSDIHTKDEPDAGALLKTLTKIRSFSVCRSRNRIRTSLSFWPSLYERIRNLEKWPTLPHKA